MNLHSSNNENAVLIDLDTTFNLTHEDVEQIDSKQGMYLKIGDVALVRSMNIPNFGDHFIVITGKPVMKEHGLRPQNITIKTANNKLLDDYEMKTGLILLKLKTKAKYKFHSLYNIEMVNGELVFLNNLLI